MRACLVALLALPGVAAGGVRPAYGGTIRIGIPAAPGTAVAQGAADLLAARAASAPLLDVDARGNLVPGILAEVPAAEADGRTFRLRVRPGVVDATGRAVGAAEVSERLTALAREGRSPNGWVALPILGADAVLDGRAPLLAGAQVLSPDELVVTLAFALPEFPWLLATLPAALPGAGPFVPAPAGAPQDPLVLRANARHHRGRPFADALELRAVDARGAARQLDQGGLDLVLRPEAMGRRPGPALPPLTAILAAVNAERLGPGAEAVRRALAGIDRADLARRFVRAHAEPLATLVPPAILPGAPPGPARRADAAARPPARVALLADASAADQRALAERIQVKLFDAGVRATLEAVEPARFAERLRRGDYDVALVSVPVAALRPALAAGQIAFAARGPAAGRRAMAELAGLSGNAALEAAGRLARELELFPLVASGLRASLSPALQGFAPRADGGFDPGDLWLLPARGAAR
jgi:peptide/nickel transport system substrate-binding protein